MVEISCKIEIEGNDNHLRSKRRLVEKNLEELHRLESEYSKVKEFYKDL
jgi:hypothetical protein